MPITEESTINFGKTATAEKFLKLLQKRTSVDRWHRNGCLIKGAIQAFHEGRPENFQTALLNIKDFKSYYNSASLLRRLLENSDDKIADTVLALETHSEQQKTKILDDAWSDYIGSYNQWTKDENKTLIFQLLKAGVTPYEKTLNFDFMKEAVKNRQPLTVLSPLLQGWGTANTDVLASALIPGQPLPVISLLLDSGAEANAFALAKAIVQKADRPAIELLIDKGATFREARILMQTQQWPTEALTALNALEKEVTGETSLAEGPVASGLTEQFMVAVLETLQKQQETIKELTERVGDLTEELKGVKKSPPKKTAAPQTRAAP